MRVREAGAVVTRKRAVCIGVAIATRHGKDIRVQRRGRVWWVDVTVGNQMFLGLVYADSETEARGRAAALAVSSLLSPVRKGDAYALAGTMIPRPKSLFL